MKYCGKSAWQQFSGWQDGYGAFTYSIDRKDILINYIKKQEEHHRTKTFREEYIDLLTEHGVSYEEKYLLKFNPFGVAFTHALLHCISCRVIHV